ncbi:MAG: tetratricopeptide repeat protein [Candidatus Krumholzibacteriia bacterium]
MKRIIPLALLAAAALVAAGLLLAERNPADHYTEHPKAWAAFTEGDRLLQSFRYAEAEAKLKEALAADPDLALAHAALAELRFRQAMREDGKRELALADSLTALVEDPRSRLLVQVRLSNTGPSRFFASRDSLLAEAKKVAPDDLIVLVSEAVQAAAGGDMARAETVWQHVLEINPNYAGAYNFLGYLYLAQGRYDEAEAAMRRYAFVAPDLANPHDSLGEVLMTVGRYEEAEVEFRTALAKQPDFFHSLVNIGRIYILRGEVDKANTLFDRVRTEMAGTAWSSEIAVRRLHDLFDHRIEDDLATYAAQFLAEAPESVYAPYVRLWRALGAGEATTAVALLDSLQSVYESSDWYANDTMKRNEIAREQLRYRGLISELQGDQAGAAQAFRQALELMSDLPPHAALVERVHLAWNLVPLGGFDEARREIRAALSVNPRLPEAVLVAAAVEAGAGETGEARRLLDTLERMLERADPDFPPLRDAQALRDQLPDPDRI